MDVERCRASVRSRKAVYTLTAVSSFLFRPFPGGVQVAEDAGWEVCGLQLFLFNHSGPNQGKQRIDSIPSRTQGGFRYGGKVRTVKRAQRLPAPGGAGNDNDRIGRLPGLTNQVLQERRRNT